MRGATIFPTGRGRTIAEWLCESKEIPAETGEALPLWRVDRGIPRACSASEPVSHIDDIDEAPDPPPPATKLAPEHQVTRAPAQAKPTPATRLLQMLPDLGAETEKTLP